MRGDHQVLQINTHNEEN